MNCFGEFFNITFLSKFLYRKNLACVYYINATVFNLNTFNELYCVIILLTISQPHNTYYCKFFFLFFWKGGYNLINM